MGVATHLQREPRGEPGVGLPQLHPGLLRQRHQLLPRPLVEPGVRGIGNVLFHHGRVDGHAPGAVLTDRPTLLPGPDRLGQQPLDPLFADPRAPAGERRWVNRQAMLEERLAGKMLVVGVLNPAGDHRLV